MRHFFVVGALVLALPAAAHAWSAGTIKGNKAEMGRLACGLIEKYGPSRSYRELSIAIPASPYGPLTATMGVRYALEIDVADKKPTDAVSAEIRAWVTAQLPAKPKACTVLLAEPAWLARVGYPDDPPYVPDEEYVAIQLDLAQQASTVDPDNTWRWLDAVDVAFSALEPAKRRKYERDPRVRAAAYADVTRPAPEGLSAVGKRGYCSLYERVASVFPPRSTHERRSLAQARKSLGCH